MTVPRRKAEIKDERARAGDSWRRLTFEMLVTVE